MAQDIKYNEEIKKLKSDRNENLRYGVNEGILATVCGGGLALWVDLLKNFYAFSPPYTAHDLILIPLFGIFGFGAVGFAIGCYSEIAESRRTSKKIRELEKGLT